MNDLFHVSVCPCTANWAGRPASAGSSETPVSTSVRVCRAEGAAGLGTVRRPLDGPGFELLRLSVLFGSFVDFRRLYSLTFPTSSHQSIGVFHTLSYSRSSSSTGRPARHLRVRHLRFV